VADPEGRRVCLFITNGTSSALVNFVRRLGRLGPVSILRTASKRMWPHTALGDALAWARADEPGASNSSLLIEDPFTGAWARARSADHVPMFPLEAARVEQWARFMMSPRRLLHPAVRLQVRPAGGAAQATRPEDRIRAFRAIASPQAYQLLRLLSAAPLTLPVMRLIQEAQPRLRDLSYLAEVMLSGLVERVTAADANWPPDQVEYEVAPAVWPMLLASLSGTERLAVEESIAPAQERLRKFVEEQTGKAVNTFRALVFNPQGD
jgi:hypothetical protein